MGKNLASTKANCNRLKATLKDFREVANGILAVARDPCKNLSEEFTEEKIQRNVEVCMRLVDCYAGSWKRPKIKLIREDIEKTQSLVIAADSVLEERMTMNPGTMGLIKSVELMIFNQMLANNPLIPFLAKLGKRFSPYLSCYLRKEFVGFRIQLELYEREQAERDAHKRRSGVSIFTGTAAHPSICVEYGKSITVRTVELREERFPFDGEKQWEIANRFLLSLQRGDDNTPNNYPVEFTSQDYNLCHAYCRAFLDRFIERQPANVRMRNQCFEPRARFRVESLKR